jgi:ech hydrogenase subunit E
MKRFTIPIGPHHPLLKEPLSLLLDVSGERIVDAAIRIGYVHRGIERLCQTKTYVQNLHLFERVCGICSHVHSTAYCQALEALAGVEVPRRAAYIRSLLCELERIHSHLLWLGVLAEAIGFTTIFMYSWSDREMVLDVMEALTGGRVSHAANVIGGVRADLDPSKVRDVGATLDRLQRQMAPFEEMIERDRSFRRRTRGIGVLTRDEIHAYGVVGPTARASGCSFDVRRAFPYAAYPELDVRVIGATDGDVWARAQVRVREIGESLRLCRQALEGLPEGPLATRVPRRVPEGEIVTRCEAPRGELLYYVRSDGSDRPARIKVRTPTLPMLMVLKHLLPGLETADVAAVMAGADLCIACADR